MAFAPLATRADLTRRGVDASDGDRVDAALEQASATVRDAAGVPISRATSTVTVWGGLGPWLELPPGTSEVTAVTYNGGALTDWQLVDGRMWRPGGWQLASSGPTGVQVTIVHGMAEVPADIVGLVCKLAAELLVQGEDGLGEPSGLTTLAFGDYREGYSEPPDGAAPLGELSEPQRERLRARFGGGVAVVGTY